MSFEALEKLNGAPFRVPGFSSFLRGDLESSKAMQFHPGGCFTNGELEPTAKLPKPTPTSCPATTNSSRTTR